MDNENELINCNNLGISDTRLIIQFLDVPEMCLKLPTGIIPLIRGKVIDYLKAKATYDLANDEHAQLARVLLEQSKLFYQDNGKLDSKIQDIINIIKDKYNKDTNKFLTDKYFKIIPYNLFGDYTWEETSNIKLDIS